MRMLDESRFEYYAGYKAAERAAAPKTVVAVLEMSAAQQGAEADEASFAGSLATLTAQCYPSEHARP